MTLQTKPPTRIFLPNCKLRLQNTEHGSMDTPAAPKISWAPNQTYCHSCIPDSVSRGAALLPVTQATKFRVISHVFSHIPHLLSHQACYCSHHHVAFETCMTVSMYCILLFEEITHSVGSKLRVYKAVQEKVSPSSASQPPFPLPTGNLYFFLHNSQRYCMYLKEKEIHLPLSPFFTQMVAHYTQSYSLFFSFNVSQQSFHQ